MICEEIDGSIFGTAAFGGDQIEYADEDPQIRRLFEKELAKQGVTCRMDEVIGTEVSNQAA